MALLNRTLTEDEARKMVADWRRDWPIIPSFYDLLREAMNEPTPHAVHYSPDTGVHYVPPTNFYFGKSACVWIVPGTLERKT